jgi:hypothetical protein
VHAIDSSVSSRQKRIVRSRRRHPSRREFQQRAGHPPDAHVRVIEAYQPYNCCKWTACLAELSNRDKHNDLVVVAQGLQIRVQASAGPEPHRVTISLHRKLGHDGQDRRVLPTLEDLGVQVTKVLDAFR